MQSARASLLLLASLHVASAFKPCPILGPVFDYPTNLANDSTFQTALGDLEESLNVAANNGTTRFGRLDGQANAFSVGVFDATTSGSLFSFSHTAEVLKSGKQGTRFVNGDSVYRIGSVSKLITAYLFLLEAGPQYWSHSITEYVPELLNATNNCDAAVDPINCIDWSAITLGSIANQLSDIPRDYSGPGELLGSSTTDYVALGFPPVPSSDVPTCNLGLSDPCPLDEYLSGLATASPVEAPFTTALYTDAGYALLGLALESITGKNISESIGPELFDKLGMTSSSYLPPTNFSNSVLPGGPIASGFTADLDNETPTGGYYSSLNDLVRLGQSILSFSLLSPAVTREWMKPGAFVSASNQAVGKPWEIWRESNLSGHLIDLYTKSGDVFAYACYFILIPDYNVGLVTLAAGNDTTNVVEYLADVVVAEILPALETAAQTQAQAKYAGRYASTIKGLNSSIVLTTQPGQPGLMVESWTSNGTNLLAVLGEFEGDAVDVRLYPTTLIQQNSTGVQTIAYRAVIETLNTKSDGGVFSPECTSWGSVDAITYGGVGIDDFVFTVQNGTVTGISPRALRATLEKEA